LEEGLLTTKDLGAEKLQGTGFPDGSLETHPERPFLEKGLLTTRDIGAEKSQGTGFPDGSLGRSPGGRRQRLAARWLRPLVLASKKLLKRLLMIDLTRDIQSLTTFRRNSASFMRQLKKSKRPTLAEFREGVRQGIDDARKGRIRPVAEFFAEFEAKNGLSH
jgi:hypothetical protein